MTTRLLLTVLFALAAVTTYAAEKKLWADSFIDKKAPELLVEKWLTPKPETKGKFILIDFWATWCGPCRASIPKFNKFQKDHADQLVVIGISDETEDKVRSMKSPAIAYASAIDTQGRTKKKLNVRGIPHVIVIDPDGIVRWEGFPTLPGHELTDAVLRKLFAARLK